MDEKMDQPMSLEEKIQRGQADAGSYFRYMLEFVGFTPEDGRTIRQAALVIEKHIPSIVADFYANLLRYPPTRKHFLFPDGSLNEDYLQKRMLHLTNFWRRTASGEYDDDYARYVDYVGRAHTSHGADPNIYIAERYVIGQVGFMQHAITRALSRELHEFDPELENRAIRAWNMVMMVILEMLARAYETEHVAEGPSGTLKVDWERMRQYAVDMYELGLGMNRPSGVEEVYIAKENEIPEGDRRLIEVNGLSLGVFHHKGQWYAVRNHCLHAGGPVATGSLVGDTLICPWHGYRYNLMDGKLLADPSIHLDMYPVELRDGEVYALIPIHTPRPAAPQIDAAEPEPAPTAPVAVSASAQSNEFLLAEVPAGRKKKVYVDGREVAVFNVAGQYYATQNNCTHTGGPLNEGTLEGQKITCPWHGSCFNVTTGEVQRGPATQRLVTYRVVVEGDKGRVIPNQ